MEKDQYVEHTSQKNQRSGDMTSSRTTKRVCVCLTREEWRVIEGRVRATSYGSDYKI